METPETTIPQAEYGPKPWMFADQLQSRGFLKFLTQWELDVMFHIISLLVGIDSLNPKPTLVDIARSLSTEMIFPERSKRILFTKQI